MENTIAFICMDSSHISRSLLTFAGGTSGNNMAIVAAEAPESSSHTGRQGALVVQPQNDSACPSWFSGFMQLNQRATQNLDDKLTTMASKQDTTLAAVQGMQVSRTAFSITACASTHVVVIGAPGWAPNSYLYSGCALLFCL